MDRVETIRRARRNYSRIWLEFIKIYDKDPGKMFCFFEGKDDVKYYGIRIDLNISSDWISLWCEGKEGVLHLFDLIKNSGKYKTAWVAFFIDKDFDEIDDLPSDDRIYITAYQLQQLLDEQQ